MSAFGSSLDAHSTCLLGGVLHLEAMRGATTRVLRDMAARVTETPEPACVEDEFAGLFTVGQATLERTDDVLVAADMDLVNLGELQTLVGLDSGSAPLLARLYALEGPAFIRRLRGAFALAIWDRRQRCLLLAVDHFGMRRLHYSQDGQNITFSSRLAPVLAYAGRNRELAPASVYSYLNFGFVPAPLTPFVGVHRLPPGHTLEVRHGRSRIEPYWDMAYPERADREHRAASSVYQLTQHAVSEALDQLPLKKSGAFLSGGTDSSTIVGLMARLTGEAVNVFSVGFQEDTYDELRYAGITARHFGAAHHTRIVTADDALSALPRLVDAYDEPFGNNSAVGTYFCAQLAREAGVSHLLAGDGGDEIYGGNERYRTDRIFAYYRRIPGSIRRRIVEPLLNRMPEHMPAVLQRAQRYVWRANIPNPRRFYSYEFYVAQNATDLLQPDFLRVSDPECVWDVLEGHFRRVSATSELNRLMYLDLKLTIGDNDLLKVTRTAELAGVGVRFPLLAVPLVEFTGTLPVAFKVCGLEKRYLFKRAFKGLLPRETLTKQKHGFGVPTAGWLKTHRGFRELARDTLLSTRSIQRGYFRSGVLAELFAQHDVDSTAFYGDILWRLLMLELWHRRHVDRSAAG